LQKKIAWYKIDDYNRIFVNHYWFHIMDKEWGHVIVKISSHPPFDVQVILNGHEWVERKALKKKFKIKKEKNCFTYASDIKKGIYKASVIAGCTISCGLV
jgi:hypothetical protein